MAKKADVSGKSTVTLTKVASGAKRKTEDGDEEVPETKKVKMSKSGALAKKPDLSKFKGLPLILLPEIFKYLSPEDLVNLCDASLIFWHALCRNSESYLWKTCRENEGIYEIPDGMNEYYWAKLLFSSRCMECGVENVRLADFYLRRRICNECKRLKCIRGRYHNGLNLEAFDCSPVTHFTAEGSKAARNKVYWKADVVQQHKRLTALGCDVEQGKPSATRALEEYKVSRRKLLRTIRAEVEDFTMYQDRYLTKKKEEKEDLFQPRYDEVESRFVKLGYLQKDFPPNMKMHKLVRSKAKLTDRAWQSILETLEPEIQSRRDVRKQQEWVKLRVSRRQTLDEAYTAHKFKNVASNLWKYLPRVHTLCMLQPIDELISCDKDRELTEGDFAPVMAQLDNIVTSAYEDTKIRLRNLVMEDADPFHLELALTQEFQDLQLATIVFRCKHCKEFIFGFEHVRRHSCARGDYALRPDSDDNHDPVEPKPFSKEFTFHCTVPKGTAQVMRMIVEVVGLDPTTATLAQMDEKDARLRCVDSFGCVVSVKGRKWSDQARHIFEYHENTFKAGELTKTEIVPEEYMPDIRKAEAAAKVYSFGEYFRRFACTHCDVYGRAVNLIQYDRIVRHIQKEHGIQEPRIDVDFVDLTGRRNAVEGRNISGL